MTGLCAKLITLNMPAVGGLKVLAREKTEGWFLP